jgi:hypothetical protein
MVPTLLVLSPVAPSSAHHTSSPQDNQHGDLSQCLYILREITAQPHFAPFALPFDGDALGAPEDWCFVIKKPMDLGCVERNLATGALFARLVFPSSNPCPPPQAPTRPWRPSSATFDKSPRTSASSPHSSNLAQRHRDTRETRKDSQTSQMPGRTGLAAAGVHRPAVSLVVSHARAGHAAQCGVHGVPGCQASQS